MKTINIYILIALSLLLGVMTFTIVKKERIINLQYKLLNLKNSNNKILEANNVILSDSIVKLNIKLKKLKSIKDEPVKIITKMVTCPGGTHWTHYDFERLSDNSVRFKMKLEYCFN